MPSSDVCGQRELSISTEPSSARSVCETGSERQIVIRNFDSVKVLRWFVFAGNDYLPSHNLGRIAFRFCLGVFPGARLQAADNTPHAARPPSARHLLISY